MKNYFLITVVILSGIIFASCNHNDKRANPEKPKYIFYFIADGMSMEHVSLTEEMLKKHDFDPQDSLLDFAEFPITGMSKTYSVNRYITGSAAAGTALATGNKTSVNTISKNADRTKPLKTIAEMAAEKDMKVGILSSVSLDHATPACFYAHEDIRHNYNSIASQMAGSGVDYFAGGFIRGAFDKYKERSESPQEIIELMKKARYKTATNRDELQALKPGTKAWAYTKYDEDAAMNYEIDKSDEEISLAEFTEKGIEMLDNNKGFFMMIEGGKIDWASHANDPGAMLHDMNAFDEAVEKAVEFYKKHPDETLIVVTSDHDCGGLNLSLVNNHYKTNLSLLKFQKLSNIELTKKVHNWKKVQLSWKKTLDSLQYYFGFGDESIHEDMKLTSAEKQKLKNAYKMSMSGKKAETEQEKLLYGGYEPLTIAANHLLTRKAGIDWSTYSHTAVAVPVFAKGAGSDRFSGFYDNTDIPKKIIEAASLE